MLSWIDWKTEPIAWAWPSARRIELCLSPSARRIALCFSPSAVRIFDCRWPSALRMAARFSRSARICFSIASTTLFGGSMALISTRVTRMPHLPEASSSTPRSMLLIRSREVRVCSRSMEPITLRSMVAVSCSIAWM